jgi:pyruvyltransferase
MNRQNLILLGRLIQNRIFKPYIKLTQNVLNPNKSSGNTIKTYWYSNEKNFGDLLAPCLFQHFKFKPIHSEIIRSDIVSVGSILGIVPSLYSGYIFGSGLIKDHSIKLPFAKIIGVRGELTWERIGSPKINFLGDPGLLADKLILERKEKKFLIGIVPHYVDKHNEKILHISQEFEKEIKVIDVQNDPRLVINEIDECEYILSSSLHGLVVADSLGIPNGWLLLSNNVVGKGFKFFDYWSVFNTKYEPFELLGTENLIDLINMTHEIPERIPMVKNAIDEAYISLHEELF